MLTLLILLHIYFVSFLNKPAQGEPALSDRAVAQRAQWNIATDELDLPVNATYLDALRQMGVGIHHTSRWFNGATCEMDETTAGLVAQLAFVTDVEMTRRDEESGEWKVESGKRKVVCTPPEYYTDAQLATYNLTPLHDAGYEGQGILMAVCDGAFQNVPNLPCFRSELELGHLDFTDDGDDFYGPTGSHGTACLSTISGLTDNYRGAATQAQYYLIRTEENDTESPKEMDNLVAALEAADSLGVNVFSLSLGYYEFDNAAWDLNKQRDLDGKTTRCSRAATIAARKGMLVCVSAGNERNNPWGTICAPADADSILTVGAVSTDTIPGSFTSYGPSSDGRVKPEVCAVGVQTALIRPSGVVAWSNGTSFSTPLVAGMAACLWSALPNENAMQIRDRIIQSAHLYPNHDPANLLGYGVPNAWEAYTMVPAGLDNGQWTMENGQSSSRKILRNGQIMIVRNGREYTIIGTQKR